MKKFLRTLPGALGLVIQVLVAATLTVDLYRFIKSRKEEMSD